MDDHKPWYQRLVEHLTGADYAAPTDPRSFDCEPLVVVLEGGIPIFEGPATVEFVPDMPDRGWARVVTGAGPPPPIYVDWYLWDVPTPVWLAGGTMRDAVLRLRGKAEDGERYEWQIHGRP